MDIGDLLSKGFDYIVSGGFKGIIALLLIFIGLLLWDRKHLQENLEKKEEKIEEILDNYYRGNLTLSEALSGLKVLLAEIKSKL